MGRLKSSLGFAAVIAALVALAGCSSFSYPRAVAWAQQHAREFGGDPERIVLMGHSAGAHMAAMLALNPHYLTGAGVSPRSIVALVGLSGPYALDPNTDTLRTIFASPYTPDDWQPVHFASDHAPPTLLLHGLDDDVVHSTHAVKLRDALLAHGSSVETHLYPNRGHAATVASFSVVARWRTPALEQTLAFLKRVAALQCNIMPHAANIRVKALPAPILPAPGHRTNSKKVEAL